MNEYLSNVIEYKAITHIALLNVIEYKAIIHIAKEWLESGIISKSEYKKVCRIIAKDCSLDLCSIFLEID